MVGMGKLVVRYQRSVMRRNRQEVIGIGGETGRRTENGRDPVIGIDQETETAGGEEDASARKNVAVHEASIARKVFPACTSECF